MKAFVSTIDIPPQASQVGFEPAMNESSLDRRYRFVIVGLLLWANFAFGLSFAAMAPILPVITEHYEISHTMAGLLVGVIFIIEATFGLPGGVIVGWLGQRRSYAISFFMMGAGTLTALSPSFEGLLALRIAYGFAIALFLPATATLLMQLFRPRVLPLYSAWAQRLYRWVSWCPQPRWRHCLTS